MSSNDSKDATPLFDGSLDQLLGNIMQGSIAMAFRQLIEPAQNNKTNSNAPPPLKLHDFGGSDFVRLAEKARRNRSTASKSQESVVHSLNKQESSLSYGNESSSPPSIRNDCISVVTKNESTKQKLLPGNDWKCTQECVVREDGSEETVYQKFHVGQVTETLHHVLYPDGTIKNIKKQVIPSSPSTTSSLSSMADDTGPFKRLWHLVFH